MESSDAFTFQQFPEELLLLVISCLHGKELLALKNTNKFFRDLVIRKYLYCKIVLESDTDLGFSLPAFKKKLLGLLAPLSLTWLEFQNDSPESRHIPDELLALIPSTVRTIRVSERRPIDERLPLVWAAEFPDGLLSLHLDIRIPLTLFGRLPHSLTELHCKLLSKNGNYDPNQVMPCTRLKTLTLPKAAHFPTSWLTQLHNLTSLDLSGYSCQGLSTLTSLLSLKLFGSRCRESFADLPTSISSLHLQTGYRIPFSSFKRLPKLRSLHLENVPPLEADYVFLENLQSFYWELHGITHSLNVGISAENVHLRSLSRLGDISEISIKLLEEVKSVTYEEKSFLLTNTLLFSNDIPSTLKSVRLRVNKKVEAAAEELKKNLEERNIVVSIRYKYSYLFYNFFSFF